MQRFSAYYDGNPAEVERLASKSIELSTRHHFAHWLPQGEVLRGWARSTSGDIAEGISWIVDGIEEFRATGALLGVPFFLALKAEALQLADRTFEALEAIREAQGLVERFEERLWRADLHRLRGVLLAAMGADETQIEASFCEAIRSAREQKSISLAETRGSNLRRISQPKSKRVRRTRIPTTSLVTARSALSLGLVVGSPALSNKRLSSS